MILETSFILDLWDEKAEAVRKAREIDARGEPTYLPTPVLYELWEGVARSERPRQEAIKIQEFVSGHDRGDERKPPTKRQFVGKLVKILKEDDL